MATQLTLTADGLYREAVRSKKRPGAYRLWEDPERRTLHGATCVSCGAFHLAAELVRNAASPGGFALKCRQCDRAQMRGYNAARGGDPEYRAARAAYDRCRVESGENAESHRARRARNRSRTPEEVAEVQRELYPSGMKLCAGCFTPRPLDEFWLHSVVADGLHRECRRCWAALRRAKRAAAEYAEDWNLWGDFYSEEPASADDPMTWDHLIPRSDFGPGDGYMHDPANLVPALQSTNRGMDGKGTKSPFAYLDEIRPGLLDDLGHLPCVVRVFDPAPDWDG